MMQVNFGFNKRRFKKGFRDIGLDGRLEVVMVEEDFRDRDWFKLFFEIVSFNFNILLEQY